MTGFRQVPPALGDAWQDDRLLRAVLRAHLPAELYELARPELARIGTAVTSPEVIELGRRAEREPPELMAYSPWGERTDEIKVSSAYEQLGRLGIEMGVTALPYENDPYGEHARVVWAAVLTMWGPSSALYSCPVAMTDAAARTLILYDDVEGEAVHRLTTRDPDSAWTSGQWMTEMTGGSDVGRTETTARLDEDGTWRLWGTKWFTSATTSEMALTLARPDGAPEGSRGLALFKIEQRLPDGSRNAISIRRLKDKLGTRAMPTAELELEDAVAQPVGDVMDGGGLRRIATMLNITRLHNAIGSAGSLARGLAWARAFADVREVFGRPLREQPAHAATLFDLAVDEAAALALVFRCAELTGRAEYSSASEDDLVILRGLTPVAKLATARWAVAGAAEAMEALGGVGYCEDSGLPALVRNAHVLPIWEGTTNVLSLDLLRAQQRSGSFDALLEDATRAVAPLMDHATLGTAASSVTAAVDELRKRAEGGAEQPRSEAAARSQALGLATTYSCARLCALAATAPDGNDLLTAGARRLATRGLVPAPGPELEELPG